MMPGKAGCVSPEPQTPRTRLVQQSVLGTRETKPVGNTQGEVSGSQVQGGRSEGCLSAAGRVRECLT